MLWHPFCGLLPPFWWPWRLLPRMSLLTRNVSWKFLFLINLHQLLLAFFGLEWFIRTFLTYSYYLTVSKGPFMYYVSREVGGWGQKMAIFADLQYYLCWRNTWMLPNWTFILRLLISMGWLMDFCSFFGGLGVLCHIFPYRQEQCFL